MILNIFWSHPFLFSYLLGINVLTFFMYGSDKLFAAAHAWRIRERTLLVLALLGGSLGAILAMQLFRHKTRKPNFQVLFTIILLLQIAFMMRLLQINTTDNFLQ